LLSEEQVSACIDALNRLGVVERVPDERTGTESFRLNLGVEGLLERIASKGYDDPPEGVDVVAWFSCMVLKSILEAKEIAVSKEEFAGMAAVIMGFISEGSATGGSRAGSSRSTVDDPRERKGAKPPSASRRVKDSFNIS
jgi:hypothetical protein